VRAALLALVLAAASLGCLSSRNARQAEAQEQLNRAGVPIDEIIARGQLDDRTRGLLAHVRGMKAFGEENGLRRSRSFERYVQLGRPTLSWVVITSESLAFRPGPGMHSTWFEPRDAWAYANELTRAGWDTAVRSSSAYSTTRRFADPVSSAMIKKGDEALGDLADTIFHETFHETFYIPAQSMLSESLATFVGDELALRYLDATTGPASPEKQAFVELHERLAARASTMRATYDALASVYRSSRTREEKLAEKARLLAETRLLLGHRPELTNATLLEYQTYGSGRAELALLLRACNGSIARLIGSLEHVRERAETAPSGSEAGPLLRPLIDAGCPAGWGTRGREVDHR